MLNFTFHNPTKIVFGTDSMDQINALCKTFGAKILLTYGGGSIKNNGIHANVLDQLKNFEVREFGGIEPNPRVETLRQAIALAKEFRPDLILAVGGGSVIDGSKLIAVGAKSDHDAWDIVLNRDLIQDATPIATVLTVSATGTEMNAFSVITNWEQNLKLGWGHPRAYPKFSILDPQNTFSLSPIQSAYGIVDVYSHVLEQYLSTTPDVPLQSRFAEGILLTLMENAPLVQKQADNYIARANIMLSATYALNGLIGAGVAQDWATHGIEHELSAFYDIPHGLGLAIVTPRWMQVAYPPKLAKFAQYGRRIFALNGTDDQVAQTAIERTHAFFVSLGIPMNLKDHGITDEQFPVMVERLADKRGEIPLTGDQIDTILRNCL